MLFNQPYALGELSSTAAGPAVGRAHDWVEIEPSFPDATKCRACGCFIAWPEADEPCPGGGT